MQSDKTAFAEIQYPLKDDKGYSYIRISDGEYRKISAVFNKKDDGSEYIGPYLSSYSVRQSVDAANKIFKLPQCNKVFPRDFGKSRPCLNYYISQCCGLCTGKIKNPIMTRRWTARLRF